MAEIRIGEIISVEEVEIGEGKSLVVVAKATGDVGRFLEAFRSGTLTIYLTEEEPLCGIKGQPSVAYPEVLSCELKKGHKGTYHKSGRFRWIGAHVEEPSDA